MITDKSSAPGLQPENKANLQDHLKFEKLVGTIFTHFVNLGPSEIDQSVNFALQAIGNFVEAERCYILVLSKDGSSFDTSFEWCPPSVEPVAHTLEQTPTNNLPWTIQQLKNHQTINISDINHLPGIARREQEMFLARNTRAFTIVPMIYDARLMGLLGFEFAHTYRLWNDDILPLLKIVGEMFVNAFERNEAEKALRASEERFRQVITSISDHVYFWKVTKEGTHENLYLSPNIEDLTGYPYSQFESNWAFWAKHVIHPDDQPSAAQQAAKLASGQDSKTEYRLVTSSGDIIWVRDSGRTERIKGEIFVYGVVAEITEQKLAQENLSAERALLAQRVQERTAELQMANAELARASRMKDEFLAAMSHELRTPLNAVLGMSEALQEQVYGPLNDRQTNALFRIEESGRHLLSLINDILDLSRINAGKLELHPWPIDTDSVCQASLHFVEKEAQKKRIRINTDIESGIRLHADERRLKQVLINLLSNAVKFTPEGGQIGLELEKIDSAEAVRFTVWDTGIGIHEEDMSHLFKPFVQLDSRLSRQYEGTGLGLTLVYKMVEMHQGSVSVESTLGEGSRFTVLLPYNTRYQDPALPSGDQPVAEPLKDESLAKNDRGHQNCLILLAEDSEANIATISDYLTARQFKVIVARNGAQVLDILREELPDLIIMDIQMPVMDGMETIRRIRSDDHATTWQDIPIVALTALAMPGDRERCLAIGANEYLSKPVGLKDLVKIIDNFLKIRLVK